MIRNFSSEYAIPFVGRTKELAEICDRLENPDCRLLTLTGLGGSGKTRLAAEAARMAASHFPHGTVFVALQPLTRSNLLIPTIAQALGLTFYGEGELQNQLLDYLHGKKLLLILDNFEHLLDGATLVNVILGHAPDVKIMVTSREALSLQEEWLYPLKGMSTPPSVYVYSNALEGYEAVQLFLYHARRVQPNFDQSSEHEAIIRICDMAAGLPLAIELAASWLKGLSAAQIAAEMQHNLDFLSTTTRNVEERHRSMRAIFDQSWKLLSENERLIFARLSIFQCGFDSDAAQQVAEASFSSLATLVEKSLIQMESAGRFSIHELLRQYGVEKLEAYVQTESAYARHSQYFADLMRRHEIGLQQTGQFETMRAIETDFENIRLAWESSLKNQQLANLHTMLNGLYLFGFLGSRYRETIALFQNALDYPITDTPLLGRLLARRWGYMHWWYQEDYQKTLAGLEQALAIAHGENNPFEMGFCYLMVAYVMINTERYAEALPHLVMSKTLFESVEEPYYVCWVLHRLGYVHYNLNHTDEGSAYTEESLALARVAHNRVALVICLYNLGSDSTLIGNYVKGSLYAEEAFQIATESGHQAQIAHAMSLYALYSFCQGDYTACQVYAEQVRTIIEDINLSVFQPYSRALLILLACLREDYAEGMRLNELGERHGTSIMDFQLHNWALAALSCGLGNPAEVRVYVRKVLQRLNHEITPAITLWIVPCVAYALAETDREKAVELLSWSLANGDPALNWVRQWPLFDRLQTQLRAQMDSGVFQMHWDKGETLSVEAIYTDLQQEFCGFTGVVAKLLTVRENEILRLMAVGMTNPQIAEELVIGAGTVKTHTLNIYRKLDVVNRTQAIVRAQELGLLQV